jgi:hypothetical protein
MAVKSKRVAPGGIAVADLLWLQGDYEGYRRAIKPWELPHRGWERLIDEYADRFLREWAATHPGTRPFYFWDFIEIPEEERRRVGGVGDPRGPEHLMFDLTFGVPDHQSWNVRGRRVFYDGPLTGTPIDPANPPTFESQASYLDRHGLLFKGERARLGPSAFEPESILAIVAWDADDLSEAGDAA